MLPGAAHLEMARAAVKQSSGIEESEDLGIEIRDVIWSRPVAVGADPVTVQIGLYPQDGEIEYEIYSEGSEDESVVHSRGVAVVKERREAERINIEQMRRQCGGEVFSGAECYEFFQRMGVEYGHGHQGLKDVRQGQDEQGRRFVLGRVEVPECVMASAGEYELHPSVMDAAFQATIGWMVESREQLKGAEGQKAALPFVLESLEIVRATPKQGWVILREGAGSGERVQKLDINICEEDGRLCARLRGFSARLLERESRAEAQQSLGVEERKAEERREQPVEPARGGTEQEAEALEVKANQYMKKAVSRALKLPMERVEVNAPLEKYGLDSILVMQVTQELEKSFGGLSKTLLFEYQTVQELTQYFLTEHKEQLKKILGLEEGAGVKPTEAVRPEAVEVRKTRGRGRRRGGAWRKAVSALAIAAEGEEVAIIGLSGRYPQARNLREYWENLKAGRDSITEIPAERWDHRLYFDAEKGKAGKSYSKWGGFLEGVMSSIPCSSISRRGKRRLWIRRSDCFCSVCMRRSRMPATRGRAWGGIRSWDWKAMWESSWG